MNRLLVTNFRNALLAFLLGAVVWPSALAAKERLVPTNTPAPPITFQDFKLVGKLSGERAVFALSANAIVDSAKCGSIDLLSGAVALTELGEHKQWDLRAEQGRYIAVFDRAGKIPVQIKFVAAVRQSGNWSAVDFRVAPSTLQPIVLKGLAADTQFEFPGAARPERKTNDFVSFLPSDGTVKLAWKEARKAEEGKLFFAAEMLSQISVSPGLMRQTALLDFKVMQGELSRVSLLLRGAGEVTRVAGEQVLSWNVESIAGSEDRRLVVQLNQPQKDAFTLQLQMQTPLGAFPQTTDAMRVQPEGATRFAGSLRIVNAGAVRLEVTQASGLSQISPEQFPETDATRNLLRASGNQQFAYRFSSAAYALKIQADQILPELNVSEVLTYNLGQSELAIDAELEVDVREAPLRELQLRVPRGYVLARITASGMSDYFLNEPTANSEAADQNELRIVYGQPVTGRQVIQLRLERNKPLAEASWSLPRIDVPKAKSVRGNVGVASDAGFRLTAERTQALTDMPVAFFPRKTGGLQTAFRLSEPAWTASIRVERLPQTIQADGLHLFSIAEGVAFGSSVINYVVSGAPVAAFNVELSDEYSNVEFTGKDIRNWQKTTNGFLVQLHTPVSGAYTLLATYDRPFKAQGDTLAFTGARPLDAQSDSGHTLITSAYQFDVKPVEVSAGLLSLEPGEVPAEYRLFFDAPILRAYRYTSRPYGLKLALSRLAQGDSLSQVVDRASLITEISKEGQMVTTARYFLKSRGNPTFRLTLPEKAELWSATVNGASVVPVKDAGANLIPLPQRADPNALLVLDLKIASKSPEAGRVNVAAPIVGAPVMLAEWKLKPDAGQRLAFIKGALAPVASAVDVSGFAQIANTVQDHERAQVYGSVGGFVVLLVLVVLFWRWAAKAPGGRFSARHVLGALVGLLALAVATRISFSILSTVAEYRATTSEQVSFLAPVQQAGSALSVEVANLDAKSPITSVLPSVLISLLGVVALMAGWLGSGARKAILPTVGWTLLTSAALRLPNGAGAFVVVVGAFVLLQVIIPGLRLLWSAPVKPRTAESEPTAPVVAVLLALAMLTLSGCATAAPAPVVAAARIVVPETVRHTVRVEEDFVIVTTKIHWVAERGDALTLVGEPAVLTRVNFPKGSLHLTQSKENGVPTHRVVADQSGAADIEAQFQLRVTKRGAESGVTLPTICGLVNEVKLTVAGMDVDATSPLAVSVQREATGSDTVATL
ncbi:MAG: hypothetical protein RLY20_672, partial [Verrucomicrobiota bacterium]